MRKQRPVHVYKDQQFIKHFNTLVEASNYNNESVPNIRYSNANKRPTRRNYVYADSPLSDQQLKDIYAKKVKCYNKQTKVTQDKDDEEIAFHFNRSKEGKKQQLKEFIYTKLRKEWLTSNPLQGKLERKFINSILEAI